MLKMYTKRRISLRCTVGYKWVNLIDGVKFEYNNIIILYTKSSLSGDSLAVSWPIFKNIFKLQQNK